MLLLALPFMAFSAPSAHALSGNALVEGAKLCTRYISRYERQYAIPTHLLSAIATTESGRYHKGLKISVPWPWTINVEGKGYYFATKAEAVAAVRKYRARGIRSIDIGCMQVNLRHHPNAFTSISNAFEPRYNVAYAAKFLKQLKADAGSWNKAAAHYHSKTSARGKNYAGSVYKNWYRIKDKLRIARIETGTRTVASVSQPLTKNPTRSLAKLPEQRDKALPKHRVPRMKVIELSQAQPQKPTIVKPNIKVVKNDTAVTVTKVKPAALSVTQTVTVPEVKAKPSGKIVQMQPVSKAERKNSPNFIFTN